MQRCSKFTFATPAHASSSEGTDFGPQASEGRDFIIPVPAPGSQDKLKKGLLLLRAFELGSSAVGGVSNPAALELSIDTAWKD